MAQNNGHNFDAPAVVGTRFPDTRTGRAGSNPISAARMAAMSDIGAMRTYLQGQAPGTYTNYALDNMTGNDMVFAIRMLEGGGLGVSNPAGIR